MIRLAQLFCGTADLRQRRFDVARRSANDPHDFGRGGLALQRLADLAVALFQLVEEAGIGNRDGRLVRKHFQDRNVT